MINYLCWCTQTQFLHCQITDKMKKMKNISKRLEWNEQILRTHDNNFHLLFYFTFQYFDSIFLFCRFMSCLGMGEREMNEKKNSVSPSFYTIFCEMLFLFRFCCCFCFTVYFFIHIGCCVCAPDIFQCDFCFFFFVLNYVLSIFNGRYLYSADTLHTYLTKVIHSSSSS